MRPELKRQVEALKVLAQALKQIEDCPRSSSGSFECFPKFNPDNPACCEIELICLVCRGMNDWGLTRDLVEEVIRLWD